ncbi:hypothetical protein M378DRAFT_17679 [Amanita muscaria Koide BX008]|uniref:Uncharacterized protein n=1 Tax=Amanita muscaria (strain Koide BX008) TaxID=946122 RepID=A0A0C2WGH7_AMAMK|nr:hypothetical protein M378DRAFT_17679 [Amanita muscaria Koide BX008]
MNLRRKGAGGITIQTQVIERLETSLEELDQLLQENKALKFKVARLNHLLEEKTRALSSAEEAETGKIHELETKITIQIKRLQAKLEQQDQLLQEMTAKLSTLEHAEEQRDVEKEEKIARLESEVARLNRILKENTPSLSSAEEAATNGEQLNRDSSATNQRQREEMRQMRQMKTAPSTSTDSEQRSMPLPPIIVNKADSISVAEVVVMVKILNAQIEQGSSIIADSLFDRESQSNGNELENMWDELNDLIGSWLCNDLKRRSKELIVEPDPVITPNTLQTGLINACSHIINDWNPPFWIDGLVFSRTYTSIEKTNDQATADAWRTLSRSNMIVFPRERQEANKRYLTEVLLRLITAVGGSLENGILPLQYNEVIEGIAKTSLELHKVVSEELVPMMELVTDTIPCDADFDPSRMEDTEGGRNETGLVTQGPVIFTTEMGLRYRKKKERDSRDKWSVAKKAKVVLARTLEE